MLYTARIALVSVVCVLALACGTKQDEPAPTKPEEPAKGAPTAAAKARVPAAAQPVTAPAADPADGEPADPAAEGESAEAASGLVPALEKLAERACACKDAACANGVQDEVAKLMSEAKQPPQSETKTIATTMQKLQGCVAAAQQK